MKYNFPRTALNCRNFSCDNTMRTGDIYIDGFCGPCYNNKQAKENYDKLPKAKIGKIELGENPIYYNKKFEIGGRKNGKRIAKLLEFDENIRQGKFPILVLVKPQEAVVISLEEYKRLKEMEKEQIEIDKLFDKAREEMASEIGLKKELLFPNIYGDEETKKKYKEYEERVVKMFNEKRPKE